MEEIKQCFDHCHPLEMSKAALKHDKITVNKILCYKKQKRDGKRNIADRKYWWVFSSTLSENITGISSVWHNIVIISNSLSLPALEGLHML